jgi:DNA helicase-2/ATP-dependent DNA helicase PcrA
MSGMIDSLNERQREAALHKDGPLLILAGAGSGKTATMTQRIARLIREEGVLPYRILAVTFTNKAAAEMRERVIKTLEDDGKTAGLHEFRPDGSAVWVMTFHAFCIRVLRRGAPLLGYNGNFTIYDPTDQKAAAKRCLKEAGFDPKVYTPAVVLSAIGKYRSQAMTPADAAREAEAADMPKKRDMAELYGRYERLLKSSNAMDFDDLLFNTVRVFSNEPEELAHWQNRFDYVMVDEYQDTDKLQYQIIKKLTEKSRNICVVGDDDQSIYRWRGADITNILNFERDFDGAKVIRLEQNYRSGGNILKCANSVIRENTERKEKALWTDRGDGDKVVYRMVNDERDEANIVALETSKLIEEGFHYGDMAVLTRTNIQARPFEEAFIKYGISYQILGQVRYYDRKEIKDMLSYMTLVQNPSDDIALARIINEPKRGIGGVSLVKLQTKAAAKGVSVLELLGGDEAAEILSRNAARAASEFAAIISSLSDAYEDGALSLHALYDEIIEKTGYAAALESRNTVEDDSRIEHLYDFRSVIMENVSEEPDMTLSRFLEKISLLSDTDNHDRSADAVSVMTMHSAKGLEYPVVFIVGMEDGLFPSLRSLDEVGGIQEERRLCYVGVTRARQRLYLLRAKYRTMYGKSGPTVESRFLAEMDKSVFDETADLPGGDVTGYFHRDMGPTFKGRPYEALRRKPAVKDKAWVPVLEPGDAVKHAKFGEGHVIEVSGNYVTVMFAQAGKKKLAADIAPLIKTYGS